MIVHAVELLMDFSQSFASLRQRPSQAKVRSTTHLRGSLQSLLRYQAFDNFDGPFPFHCCSQLWALVTAISGWIA
jgi:hypothetical protein